MCISNLIMKHLVLHLCSGFLIKFLYFVSGIHIFFVTTGIALIKTALTIQAVSTHMKKKIAKYILIKFDNRTEKLRKISKSLREMNNCPFPKRF